MRRVSREKWGLPIARCCVTRSPAWWPIRGSDVVSTKRSSTSFSPCEQLAPPSSSIACWRRAFREPSWPRSASCFENSFRRKRGGRLRALLTGGAELDHLLAGQAIQEIFGRLRSRDQKGFYTHRLLDELGLERARSALLVLRDGLGRFAGTGARRAARRWH